MHTIERAGMLRNAFERTLSFIVGELIPMMYTSSLISDASAWIVELLPDPGQPCRR
jgi:hypothetical protein